MKVLSQEDEQAMKVLSQEDEQAIKVLSQAVPEDESIVPGYT